jgi:hypothetical protein
MLTASDLASWEIVHLVGFYYTNKFVCVRLPVKWYEKTKAQYETSYNETDEKHVGYKEDFANHSPVTTPIVQMNAIYHNS